MKPAIHYEFIAKLIKRKKKNGEFEFIETMKEFYNDEPINAREEALEYYQNYIEGMLEFKGLKYDSDRQAREALESFHNPKTESKSELLGKEFYIPDSLGNGMGVFMVIDEIIEDRTDQIEIPFDNYELIHGMGDLMEGSFYEESLTLSLEREVYYYKHFKYNTENYITDIIFCNSDEWLEGYREDQPETLTILITPFDWSGMDKPYWWGEPEEDDKDEENGKSDLGFEDIISEGESNQVEFKQYFLTDKLGKKSKAKSKKKVADTICAFLNSRGGFLFIGIDDKTEKPVGLIEDLKIANISNAKDYFKQQIDELIYQYLPEYLIDNITGKFIKVSGVEIFLIVIYPSKRNPIFIKRIEGLQFYIRRNVSTKEMKDMSEIANYCVEHWCKKTD